MATPYTGSNSLPSATKFAPKMIPVNQPTSNSYPLQNITNANRSVPSPSGNGYSLGSTLDPRVNTSIPTDQFSSTNAKTVTTQAVTVPSKSGLDLAKLANSPAGKALGLGLQVLAIPTVVSEVAAALADLTTVPQRIKNVQERERLNQILDQQEKQAQKAASDRRMALPSPSRGGNTGLPDIDLRKDGDIYNVFITFTTKATGQASEPFAIGSVTAPIGAVISFESPNAPNGDTQSSGIIVNGALGAISFAANGSFYKDFAISSIKRADGQNDPKSAPPYIDLATPVLPPNSNNDNYFPYSPTLNISQRAGDALAPPKPSVPTAPSPLPFKEPDRPKVLAIPPVAPAPLPAPNPLAKPNEKLPPPKPDDEKLKKQALPTGYAVPTSSNAPTGSSAFSPTGTPVVTTPLDPSKQPSANQNPLTQPLNPPVTSPPIPAPNETLLDSAGFKLTALGVAIGAVITGIDYLKGLNQQINNQTTPQAQQTNAKQGVCDAMQPQQCGYEGVKQAATDATNPIKDIANANNGLLANALTLLNNLWTFLQNSLGKVLQLLNNQVVDRTLGVMNLVTNIHNAALLTRDIGETLGSVVDNIIGLTGLRFTNSEGSQVGFTDVIGSNFRGFLIQVLGAERYVELTLNWQKASMILNSAAQVLNTTQSMIDPLSSALEYGMENVSKIGNSLKEDGVVSENAYPAMDETIRARRVNRFERLNDTLEGAENIASNLSSVTSSAVSVKEDYKQLREDSKGLRDKATAFNTADETARAELKASLPTNITPIILAPAPAEDEAP